MKPQINEMSSSLRKAIDSFKEGNYLESVKWLDVTLNDISKIRQIIVDMAEKEKS